MNQSPELGALEQKRSELELALKDNLRPILDRLERSGLVKSEIYDTVKEMKSSLSSADKALMVVSSIIDAVSLSGKSYHELMKILCEEKVAHQYRAIVSKIKSSYCDLDGMNV